MPKDYRVLMVGPSCAGVKTQAEKLSEFYGWKVVDYPKIVREKLAEVNEMPEKLPNNISEEGPCMVCLNQKELDDIRDHKPFPAQKFMPWILEFLGVPLAIRPPPPPEAEPNTEEMSEEELKAYNKKQAELKKAKDKADDEEAKKLVEKAGRETLRQAAIAEGRNIEGTSVDYSVDEIIIDDLEIDKLVPNLGDKKKLHVPGGFIMYGFPQAEAHIEKLKEAGIEFDRVIYMTDTNEEEPGKVLVDRHAVSSKSNTAYEWDLENERCTKIMGQVKEFIGEETVDVVLKEIDCGGDADKVFIKIRTAMDPFFIQLDNPDDVRTTAGDLDNLPPTDPEELAEVDKDALFDRHLPRSDFGPYCPVTYVRDGFMINSRGRPDELGIESTINGKTYYFAGEAE
jgi:adenylate kinase family enzyme